MSSPAGKAPHHVPSVLRTPRQGARADAAGNQRRYREEGETVLIVRGRLISGPWLCDRCNAELDAGMVAWLVSAFPRWVTESTPDYDFASERRYFALEGDEVTAYGAAWPGVA